MTFSGILGRRLTGRQSKIGGSGIALADLICFNCGLAHASVGNLCRACYQFAYRTGRQRPNGLIEKELERRYERFVRLVERRRAG